MYKSSSPKSNSKQDSLNFEIDSDLYYSMLWEHCWKPLMISMSIFCTDKDRNSRGLAFSYLQRALLQHDLQALSVHEWENCFFDVIFPLIQSCNSQFPLSNQIENSIEETHLRATQLMCKVFLQHLTALLDLSNFNILWFQIIKIVLMYISTNDSEILGEALPELLKNMILVMKNLGAFDSEDNTLWDDTIEKVTRVLPHFISNLEKINCRNNTTTASSAENEDVTGEEINNTSDSPPQQTETTIEKHSDLLNPDIIDSVMSIVDKVEEASRE